MRFEACAEKIRDQVKGYRTVAREGAAAVDVPGLLKIVQARVSDPTEREQALLALGFIQGVASMLQGLGDSKAPPG